MDECKPLAVGQMMESLPLRAIRGLGGKFGEQVEQLLVSHLSSGGGGVAGGTGPGGSGRGSSSEGGFMASALQSLPAAVGLSISPASQPSYVTYILCLTCNNEGLHMVRPFGLAVTRRFSDPKTALWLSRVSRGEDLDPVLSNVGQGAKSMNAFKSFPSVPDAAGVHRWLRILAGWAFRTSSPPTLYILLLLLLCAPV